MGKEDGHANWLISSECKLNRKIKKGWIIVGWIAMESLTFNLKQSQSITLKKQKERERTKFRYITMIKKIHGKNPMTCFGKC